MTDQEIIVEEVSENKPKKKVTAGRVVHLTAAIVLFILATVAIVLATSMAVEFLQLRAIHDSLEGTSDQLGNGIAQVFLIVFALVFGVISLALSVISLILSSTVWKYRLGRERIFGMIATILSALYIVCAVVVFLIMVGSGS